MKLGKIFICALLLGASLSACVTTVTKKTSGYRPVATPTTTDSNKTKTP